MSNEQPPKPGGTTFGDNAQNNVVVETVHGDFINQAPTLKLSALHQLEPPPVDFVGREAELTELLAMVKQGGVTISGLQGLGGVGKTTLALKLAALLKADYPDAQFFLDLKGPEPKPLPATEALKHVIRAYHPTVALPESPTELRAQYLSVLDGQRVLLLMDNARDEAQIKPLLPPPGCLLLVTSRFHFTVPGLKVKHLDALPPDDAVKLLLEIAPRIGDHAAEIAKLCGNLPLGLRVAASFITQRSNFKVEKLVGKLRENREWMEPIQASLCLSHELLREELKANWRALVVFPDSFDQRAAAAVWDLDEEQTQERLGDLLNFSLVEWSEEMDRYRLHDLARGFADGRLTDSERLSYQHRHAEHFLRVLTEANDLYQQGGKAIQTGLALFDREWGNTEAGWEWVIRSIEAIPRALELCSEYPGQRRKIFAIRQHARDSVRRLEVALAAAQKLGRKSMQCWHLGNLGADYAYLGQPNQAIKLNEQALAISREIGDRGAEANALNNLGNAYKNLGIPLRAAKFYEQTLAIVRETGDHRGEGTTLNNLGATYGYLGDLQSAIEFFEKALAIRRKIGDRAGEGSALNNLGSSYIAMEDFQRAIECFELALTISCEIGDRKTEGLAYWNKALVVKKLGYDKEAIVLAETALVIFDQIEHPAVSGLRRKLAKWRGEGGAANE